MTGDLNQPFTQKKSEHTINNQENNRKSPNFRPLNRPRKPKNKKLKAKKTTRQTESGTFHVVQAPSCCPSSFPDGIGLAWIEKGCHALRSCHGLHNQAINQLIESRTNRILCIYIYIIYIYMYIIFLSIYIYIYIYIN